MDIYKCELLAILTLEKIAADADAAAMKFSNGAMSTASLYERQQYWYWRNACNGIKWSIALIKQGTMRKVAENAAINGNIAISDQTGGTSGTGTTGGEGQDLE